MCFFTKSINYLGFITSGEGVSPNKDKVFSVKNAPAPKYITQLKSYSNLLHFYLLFIPNMST